MTLSRSEARALTDEVKADTAALWDKMERLYHGKAHVALNFESWGAYCKAEFRVSVTRAYELLDAGRVATILSDSAIAERPRNEAVARELAPLRDDPEALRGAWRDAVEAYGEAPTAEQVRDMVRPIPPPPVPPPPQDYRFEAPAHALRILQAAMPKPEDALWPVDQQGDVDDVDEALAGLEDWIKRARRSWREHKRALKASRGRHLRSVDAA